MIEESNPSHSTEHQEQFGEQRRISIALTHSEWIDLKIALGNEIARQAQEDSHSALQIERLQQLRARLSNEIE